MKLKVGDIVILKDNYFQHENLVGYHGVTKDDRFELVCIYTINGGLVRILNLRTGNTIDLHKSWIGGKKYIRDRQISKII